jgi:AcrR family transcriptional regulator
LAKPQKHSHFQRRAPKQARSRMTVDAILDAAARILRSGGTEALTTNAISDVAGVGVGTLYGYFPNKTAVLVALARRVMAEDAAAIIAAGAAASGDDPVRTLVHTMLERHRQDAAVRRAVMSVHHAHGLSSEHSQAAERTVARLLADRGVLSPFGDANATRVFVLTRAVLGVARAMIEEGAASPPDAALEDELVRLAHRVLE